MMVMSAINYLCNNAILYIVWLILSVIFFILKTNCEYIVKEHLHCFSCESISAATIYQYSKICHDICNH